MYFVCNHAGECLAKRKSKEAALEVLATYAQADMDMHGVSFGKGVDG